MNKLYPFQQEAINAMLKRKHNLLADLPGMGKTPTAIGYINALKAKKVLIICNASIKTHWFRMLKKWLDDDRIIQIVNGKQTFISHELTDMVIINYDIISHSYIFHQLQIGKWDLVIADECHKLKSMKAERTQAVLARNGIIHTAKRSLMLTGTPVLNRPVELYPLLKVCAPQVIHPYIDYFAYGRRYCAGYQDGFSFNTNGASNIDELNKKLRAHYMIRRTYEEVSIQMPPKRFEFVLLDQAPGMKLKLEVLNQASRKDFKYQNLEGESIATVRREIAEGKVEAAGELIKEYIEANQKIVIFAYHHSVITKLEGLLNEYGTVTLTGNTSQSQRQSAIDKFGQDPNCKVFLGQIQAAGEGIDGLQRVCSTVLFVESSWVPGEIEQAIKRVDRIGQTKPVHVRFLVWADSVDEHMLRVALEKVETIRGLLR